MANLALDNAIKRTLYEKWSTLVNMTHQELQRFHDSPAGKDAGLSKEKATSMGIRRGRDSAKAIIKMLQKDPNQWTEDEWSWAKHQVGFISRMKGNPGPDFDAKGRPTRKLKSLLIWGHKPFGVDINRVCSSS